MTDTYDDEPLTPDCDPDSECYATADEPEPEPERDWHQEWKDDQMRRPQEEPSDLDWYGDSEGGDR
jgi:hypothetical protein